MINIENNKDNIPSIENDFVEVVRMDIQCHIVIKDTETSEVLVNKRG